ncbi:MAG: Stk1 family PASTA domain-containing Ser/Thr kinase [Oscillospiraceae bacterium]|nr:Stk1 family PASTA domain-containing Ser/Thr kinase [Oscillospiraceae bacterium]
MSNTENLVGSTLSNRYTLLSKIGTGGMAMVYKAHDKVLDRDVAIKILRESYESESMVVENFIKEARSSASLVHPNIVSVYDVCEFDGFNYMVMELVDGITLKEYIKANPRMPWQEACDYAIQIAQGIQAAHERGIIHRDIKPQNIIMAPGGVLKVTDFGIAKAMENDKSIAGGTALGSVHYISPEQAKGGYTDFRSDIYSLGIVLYEMLAGRVPFDGDSPVSVALMHIEEEAVNVKCVNLDVPTDLAYITMKAMSREPAKRYQNTRELLDDLRAVLADETLPSLEAENTDNFPVNNSSENRSEINIVTKDDIMPRGRNTRTKIASKSKLHKKRAERNSILLAFATVAAIVLVAAAIIVVMLRPFSKTVPDLMNMSLEDAYKEAEKSKYKIDSKIEYTLSDSVPEDYVITQFPEPGADLDKRIPIKLVVSLGPSGGSIEVPNLENMKLEDAIIALNDRSLGHFMVEEDNEEVEEGYITRQTPAAGTHLKEGDIVTIHYSVGKKPVYKQKTDVEVPALTGYTLDNASSHLISIGLGIDSVSNSPSSQPAGIVIRQSPDPGTKLKEGDTVSVVVSNGGGTETVQPKAPQTESNNSQPVTETNTTPTGGSAAGHMYTVRIPADAANDTVNVKIVANGETVHDAVHSKTEGQVAVEIHESGSVSIQAYIDGAKISDKTVTF